MSKCDFYGWEQGESFWASWTLVGWELTLSHPEGLKICWMILLKPIIALQFIDITMQVEAPFKFYPSVTHNTQIPRTYTSFLQGSHLYKKQKNLSAFFWLFRRLNKAILSAKLFAKTY